MKDMSQLNSSNYLRNIYMKAMLMVLLFISSTVIAYAVTVTPAAHDFGEVSVGESSSKTFELTNNSPTTLTIESTNISGQGLAVELNNCQNLSLAPAQVCTLAVVYAPINGSYIPGKLEIILSNATSIVTVIEGGIKPTLLKDINIGIGDSSAKHFTAMNGVTYFSAQNSLGTELWKTDGTPEGTQLVKDIWPGVESSNPSNFIVFNNLLYFSANDGVNGSELWVSDGTDVGTLLFKDINLSASSNPTSLITDGVKLYFSAIDGSNGVNRKLWRSDGSVTGTVSVSNDSYSSKFGEVLISNGILFFSASDFTNGKELWRSDGTANGTYMLTDRRTSGFFPLPSASSSPSNLVDLNGTVYFVATDNSNGRELWESNGFTTGTHQRLDIKAGENSSNPTELVVVNDNLYFLANSESFTDTKFLYSLNPFVRVDSETSVGTKYLINVDDTLFYHSSVAINNNRIKGIWKYDGQVNTLVVDGSQISNAPSFTFDNLKKIEDRLFFELLVDVKSEIWEFQSSTLSAYRFASFDVSLGKTLNEWYTSENKLYLTVTDSVVGEETRVYPLQNAPYVVQQIEDQQAEKNVQIGPLTLLFGDQDTPADQITITVTSNNQYVLANENIEVVRTGNEITLNLIPSSDTGGAAEVNIAITDGFYITEEAFIVDWQNTPHTVTSIENRIAKVNETIGPVTFTITDDETPTDEFLITVSSSDQTLVSDSNIDIIRNGSEVNLSLIPTRNYDGSVTITVFVNDGQFNIEKQFTVEFQNTSPVVSAIDDKTQSVNQDIGPVIFTVSDSETPPDELYITVSSSNETLLPKESVKISRSQNDISLNLSHVPGEKGVSLVTVSVSDGRITSERSFVALWENNFPTISSIENQSVAINQKIGPIVFAIGDEETQLNDLNVSIINQDSGALIGDSNIDILQSGEYVSLTLTPELNVKGIANIIVQVFDGYDTTELGFQVSWENTVPQIVSTVEPIYDAWESRVIGPIEFEVEDAESSIDELEISISSTNKDLMPEELYWSDQAKPISGFVEVEQKVNKFFVTFYPQSNNNGTSNISVHISDGVDTVSQSFNATWKPAIIVDQNKGHGWEFEIIQEGIDNATNGETVIVSPGTYMENDIKIEKSIFVIAEKGPLKTSIDANSKGTGFYVSIQSSSGAFVDGFTIQNGSGYKIINQIDGSTSTRGGGIYLVNGNFSIKNVNLLNNTADFGGGIFIRSSWTDGPLIENSNIINNSSGSGGGVYVDTSTDILIENTNISNNAAHAGGGLALFGNNNDTSPDSKLILDKNSFLNNFSRLGGAIYVNSDKYNYQIVNSILVQNEAELGGAVYVRQSEADDNETFTGEVINSTIVANIASDDGGALYFDNNIIEENLSKFNVLNTVIWGNVAEKKGNQIKLSQPDIYQLFLSHGNIEGGIYGIIPYSSNRVTTNNLFTDDPLLAFPKDPQPTSNSILIDSGSEEVLGISNLDRLDNDRNLDGDNDEFSAPDIGAYEYLGDIVEHKFAVSPQVLYFNSRKNLGIPSSQKITIKGLGYLEPTFTITTSSSNGWLYSESGVIVKNSELSEIVLNIAPEKYELLEPGSHSAKVIIKNTHSHIEREIPVFLQIKNVLRVGSDAKYKNIQEAIDVANDGDDIVVANGTYSGVGNTNINLNKKSLNISSESGPLMTHIDCEQSGYAFDLGGYHKSKILIKGFTIKNCLYESSSNRRGGGAVVIREGSYIEFNDNIFFANSALSSDSYADTFGGAIFSDGDNVKISNCKFLLNKAVSSDLIRGNGGAIYIGKNAGHHNIESSLFMNNSASRHGGAVYIETTSEYVEINKSKFIQNRINNNNNSISTYGGALYIRSDSLIKNSMFSHNEPGGIFIHGNETSVINSIFNNNVDYDITTSASNSSSLSIINSTFHNDISSVAVNSSFNNTVLANVLVWGDKNSVSLTGDGQLMSSVILDATVEENPFINLDPLTGLCDAGFNEVFCTKELDAENYNALCPDDTIEPLTSNCEKAMNPDLFVMLCGIDYTSNFCISEVENLIIRLLANDKFKGYLQGNNFRINAILDQIKSNDSSKEYLSLIDKGSTDNLIFSDYRDSLRPIDGNGDGIAEFDIGAIEYSKYYGDGEEDQIAKAFKELEINSNTIVTGFPYIIRWQDKDPFPSGDIRVSQAGQYAINLALVDDSGNRADLINNEVVELSTIGYDLETVFNSNHLGNWYVRLELAKDPNQFVLSDKITIEHKPVTEYELGTAISPPIGADVTQKPDIEFEEFVYWSAVTQKLYAVAPGTTVITWFADEQRSEPIPVVAQMVYPELSQTHILETQAVNLLPENTRFDSIEEKFSNSGATLSGNAFSANNEGYTVLLFRDADAENADEQEVFEVVRSVAWNHQASSFPKIGGAIVGEALIENNFHNANCDNGYVFFENAYYDGFGESKAYDRETRLGPIYPVNTMRSGSFTDDQNELVVVWFQQNTTTNVCWPATPVQYTLQWPENPKKIVIASEQGSGPLDSETYGLLENMLIYNQANRTKPGFNPNEEHAAFFTAQGSEFPAIFPLRTDLNRDNTSGAYVLLKYQALQSNEWQMQVFQVEVSNENDKLEGEGEAGQEIDPPYPLDQANYTPCSESFIRDNDLVHALKDKDAKLFAYQGDVTIDVHYFYKLQTGFYYDTDNDGIQDEEVGTCVPWLEAFDGSFEHLVEEPGLPIKYTYKIDWPTEVPSLFTGETLVDAKTQRGEAVGLPNIGNQCKVDVLYDQSVANNGMDYTKYSVNLIDAIFEYASDTDSNGFAKPLDTSGRIIGEDDFTNPEAQLPFSPKKNLSTGRWVFTDLPYHIQSRLTYDEVTKQLKLKGVQQSGFGEPMLLLNILTERDLLSIQEIYPEDSGIFWQALRNVNNLAISKLQYPETGYDQPIEYENNRYPSLKDAELKALTAGDARGAGYVSLAFNNHPDCPAPTMLSVIKVIDQPYEGEIKVIESTNPFEEKVTLKHNSDFGGAADNKNFQWMFAKAEFSGIPCRPEQHDEDPDGCAQANWKEFNSIDPITPEQFTIDGDTFHLQAADTVIKGSGEQLLPDKWFAMRYYFDDPLSPKTSLLNKKSAWTKPQLYEGWIKRVMKKINLFDQKVKDFHAAEANSTASMISLAGQRAEGQVALSDDPEYLQDLGIIEVYETLLQRANGLTQESGDDLTDLNKSLLFAANRLADLYMLLGNEAYGDSADPTIGFSTDSGIYGTRAPSIFSFQNQTESLIAEELALLRGRDDAGVRPFYNRLVWNFTLGDGEVAYKENYNITDQDEDGDVDEFDAQIQYPQGHGDAWGHYLSAVKKYYGLLKKENFTWEPQSEAILVGGVPVEVDYTDERKFASAAAARARAGAEIVNLTYRDHYSANPEDQWIGYKDENPDRAWGVDGWSRRAGQAALFDWVMGNAMLPSKDPKSCDLVGKSVGLTSENCRDGIHEIDRTTVIDIWNVASNYQSIEAEVNKADAGLNPLGLAHDSIAFDIDPQAVANGETHFEQIYNRAAQAINNAISVFNHANESSQLLRRQQDSLTDFKRNIENSEADFNNRLVEIYGNPYPEDCGPGKTYSTDYCDKGPDLYHFMYVDESELMGKEAPKAHNFEVEFFGVDPEEPVNDQGELQKLEGKVVTFNVATDSRFGIIKPEEWSSRRKTQGEIQFARSELLQSRGRFEKALLEYDNLVEYIESQADLIEVQYGVNRDEIRLLNESLEEQKHLNNQISDSRSHQLHFRTAATVVKFLGDALAEGFPTSIGFSNDPSGPLRVVAKAAGVYGAEALRYGADRFGLSELGSQQSKEIESAELNAELTTDRGEFAIDQQLLQLENQIRSEASLRQELYLLVETMQQAAQRYLAALARGDRLLQDRLRFRKQTAAQVIDYRYKDMSFRIFRNDALEKYRAQFDMAAMYVYLAAKAYDYETTLLDSDNMAGQYFLTNIIRQRSIGSIENGQPLTGTGLADPMRRMWQNFQVLKPQLGFNNPQVETNRFSLRQELFRIRMDAESNDTWKRALEEYREDNLWDVPEFRRYARPFGPEGVVEPGLVIPFSTTVTSGLNYFNWPLGGGDSNYSASNFATKVRSVGVWFSNYNSVGLAETPRVYLIPVGTDILRTPSTNVNEIRTWQVIDQKLPLPFPIVESEFAGNPNWIPMVDSLGDEPFQIRRHSDFRAYHDSGFLNQSEMQYDSRLVGRSVWNNRWLLIIPGRNLENDPDEGLDNFIYGPRKVDGIPGEDKTLERTGYGVSDIKLFFETYSYSGN